MELVVTKVERGVDGLEWFEVNVNLSLFPFRGDDFTTVDDETVGRDFVVELETLLGGGNGRQHRQTVDPGFDVRSGTLCTYVNVVDPVFPGALSYVFFSQHLRGAGNLIFGSWMLLVLTFLAEPAREVVNIRMISEIMEVPFPLAASSRLMSFLTFHISIFFSASLA